MLKSNAFHLSEFHPAADGTAIDDKAFAACFAAASAPGSVIVIDPGTYRLEGKESILLHSQTTVHADGAVFLLPDDLGDKLHRIIFYGNGICDFSWNGGTFIGHVFRPDAEESCWEPNACVRCIYIESWNSKTENIRFERVCGKKVAGAVISVYGQGGWNRNAVRKPAVNVVVKDCDFELCGNFMWDYGYLWERITFPERFDGKEIGLAREYITPSLISGGLSFGREWIEAESLPGFKDAPDNEYGDSVTFFGDNLPQNIQRGIKYKVFDTKDNALRIADPATGRPMRFSPAPGGTGAKLFRNLFSAFHGLYMPGGGGDGKGSMDLSDCDNVSVTGCRMSAAGDTMHIIFCHHVVFSNNRITGSRMGAFYIAAYCRDVTVTGNVVDGTNGSRVLSIERSAEDITVVGNTFRGGGRGSWINQPYNLIMADNLFLENTRKCDPVSGRLCPDGGVESYPEIYFTTWEKNAKYGPVIFRGNIVRTMAHNQKAAIAFYDGGEDIILESNVFQGEQRRIFVGRNCAMPQISGNIGAGGIIREW